MSRNNFNKLAGFEFWTWPQSIFIETDTWDVRQVGIHVRLLRAALVRPDGSLVVSADAEEQIRNLARLAGINRPTKPEKADLVAVAARWRQEPDTDSFVRLTHPHADFIVQRDKETSDTNSRNGKAGAAARYGKIIDPVTGDLIDPETGEISRTSVYTETENQHQKNMKH